MIWPRIPEGVDPVLYYTMVGLSVLIVGISKSGFGGGTGVVAIVVMATVMPPKHMLGVMLPVLIAGDILANLHYLRDYEWRHLRPLLGGALVGIVAGSATFWLLQGLETKRFETVLSVLVGSICLLFVAVQVYALTGRPVAMLPVRSASSLGVGTLAGFVSTLTHSAGPIVTLYLMQDKTLEKRRLVGTLVLYFLLVNSLKVPTFVKLGTINGETLRDSVWFIPLLPVGTLLGAWLHRRIPEKPFAAVMYTAAAVTAGQMIVKSLL
jgi:hypothetical protein